MKDINQLYEWAISDDKNASTAGAYLLSLWDGERFQVNLQQFLQCDESFYHTTRTVFAHLYVNNHQLTDYMSDDEILLVIDKWGVLGSKTRSNTSS